MVRLLQSPYTLAEWACLVWAVSLLYSLLIAFVIDSHPPPEVSAVRFTAGLAVVYWALGAVFLLRLRPDEWQSPNERRREAAIIWLLGFLAMAWHVAIAFDLIHG